jgi:ribosomal small subunit protein bTHX
MGKGDKKSRRGKIHIGTFGKRRRPNKGTVLKPEQIIPAKEKVEKVKKVAPVVEVEQPVAAPVMGKPAKAKVKKAEVSEPAEQAPEKKPVKKAPKKAKETPVEEAAQE